MTVQSFTHNPFPTNGYVVHDACEAAIIDAPSSTEAERAAVAAYIEEKGLEVRHLLLTHAHIDHVLGCAWLAERFPGAGAWQLHAGDRPFAERAREQAAAFGVPLGEAPPLGEALREGDVVALGNARLEVLHTPGHSPGSVTFLERGAGRVLSGDVLFRGSIGRTEGLPETSLPRLMRSIEEKLLTLPDETAVHPGHGEATTIGRERQGNPFLNGQFSAAG